MRTRSGAMLTATVLGAVLAMATPSYAATAAATATTQSSPYDISVAATLDPSSSGSIHSNVTVRRLIGGVANLAPPLPAGSLRLRWFLYNWDPSLGWQLCKQSDPRSDYSLSLNMSSAFTLNLAQTECGDGMLMKLVTEGGAWVNNNWHGGTSVLFLGSLTSAVAVAGGGAVAVAGGGAVAVAGGGAVAVR